MNPRERCLALLEAKRVLREIWMSTDVDYERRLIEGALVSLTYAARALCTRHGLPWE